MSAAKKKTKERKRKKNVRGSRLESDYHTDKNATLLIVQYDIISASCVFGKLQNGLFMYFLKMISYVPRGVTQCPCASSCKRTCSDRALFCALTVPCRVRLVPPVRQRLRQVFSCHAQPKHCLGVFEISV